MGGCKCTFQDCGLTTTSSKKLYPDRETHFFHFPVRDPERCVEWAVYSNNMNFLQLPANKILNKVICDFHFKESNFMNYKRERLTKTTAVPTIYISPKTGAEVDLLTNPTSWVEANQKKSLSLETSSFLTSEEINIDEQSHSVNTIEDQSSGSPSPVVRKLKENNTPVIRILNGKTPSSGEVTVQRFVKKLPIRESEGSPPSKILKLAGEHYTIRKITSPSSKPSSSSPKIIKQEIIKASTANTLVEVDESTAEIPADDVPLQFTPVPDKAKRTIPSTSEKITEDLKPILMDFLKQTQEINEMLKKKQSEPVASTSKDPEEKSNFSQSHLNKVQLFNGIKRYLSPSMNALLRIELFSTPGREYKKDEKLICQELLLLGDKTYNFLSDEWRLRLPAKKEVERWIEDLQTEEDDDAS